MSPSIKAILLAGSTLAFASCQTNPKHTIQPPFENVAIQFESFQFDPTEAHTFALASGTRIHVPANALVLANGKLPAGEVELKYREFHTAAEIMVSGIPMAYDSAGKQFDFESAGMFDLRGFQGTETLQVATGKALEVELASERNETDFNSYRFDEAAGEWTFLNRSEVQANAYKSKAIASITQALDATNEPLQPNDEFYFDLTIDYSAFAELKVFDGLKWKPVKKDGKSPAEVKSWVFKHKWREVQIDRIEEQEGLYQLSLKSKKKAFACTVTPYSESDRAQEIAAFDAKLEVYKATKAERLAALSRARTEANFLRKFTVQEFGICNVDRVQLFVDEGKLKIIDASFEVNATAVQNDQKVFHIYENNQITRIRTGNVWKNMQFDPRDRSNKILTILPGDEVAICRAADFNQLAHGSSNTIDLKPLKQKVTSVAELQALIEGI